MKRFAALCSTVAILWMVIACNQPADTRDADVKAIKDLETQWNKDWAGKDPAKLMTYYADDAILIAPGGPPDAGTEQIRKGLEQMVSDPTLSLKFQASKVEAAKSGDIAYTEGAYTLDLTDPGSQQMIHDHGNYATTYRKQPDGSWKAVVDIASTGVAPMAMPAQKK